MLSRYDGDWMRSYQQELGTLLQQGVRVLIFAGDADFLCNWQGIFKTTTLLKWKGQRQYTSARKQLWKSEAKGGSSVLGSRVSAAGLTFLRVFKAGHMVPRDQPAAAAQLFDDFLHGRV